MSQLSVQQGHVYEGDNRSGRRRERNLKSLSFSLSLSFSCVVSLHPTQSTRITSYVNTHTQRDACHKRAHAYASATFPHTRHGPSGSRVKYSPPFRIPRKIEGYYPRDSRAIASIDTKRVRSVGQWGRERHPLRQKPRFRRRVCSSSKKEQPRERVAGSRVRSR